MGLPFAHERRFVRSRLACCDPLCVVSGAVRPYGAYHGGRDGTHTADINSTIMYMGSSPSPARARHQPGIG